MWGATRAAAVRVRVYEFQLTLPVWGATADIIQRLDSVEFQLTLPVWGATFPLGWSSA